MCNDPGDPWSLNHMGDDSLHHFLPWGLAPIVSALSLNWEEMGFTRKRVGESVHQSYFDCFESLCLLHTHTHMIVTILRFEIGKNWVCTELDTHLRRGLGRRQAP